MPLTKKFTEQEVADALRQYGTFVGAAKALNCSDRTISNYCKDSAALEKAAQEGRARITQIAVSNVVQKILEGDDKASRWWLQASPPGKALGFGNRTELAAAPLIDPTDFAPERPKNWAEARAIYPDIQDVALNENGEAPAALPQAVDALLGDATGSKERE